MQVVVAGDYFTDKCIDIVAVCVEVGGFGATHNSPQTERNVNINKRDGIKSIAQQSKVDGGVSNIEGKTR